MFIHIHKRVLPMICSSFLCSIAGIDTALIFVVYYISVVTVSVPGSGQRNLERGEWLQNSTEFVRNSNDDDLLESNNKRNNTENQHIVQEESDGSCKSSETAESKSGE